MRERDRCETLEVGNGGGWRGWFRYPSSLSVPVTLTLALSRGAGEGTHPPTPRASPARYRFAPPYASRRGRCPYVGMTELVTGEEEKKDERK